MTAVTQAAYDEWVAEQKRHDALVERVADALMDARASWPWNEPPSTLTYQESMRRLARLILMEVRVPAPDGARVTAP